MTILFDTPVETGLERAGRRTAGIHPEAAEDRFEQEDLAFHGRIRQGYLSLAAEDPKRFRIIDGTAGIDAIQADVRGHLGALMEGPPPGGQEQS